MADNSDPVEQDIPEDERTSVADVGLPGLASFLIAFLAADGPVPVSVGGGRDSETGEALVFMACDDAEFAVPVAAARSLADIAEHGIQHDDDQEACQGLAQLMRAIRAACDRADRELDGPGRLN